MLWISVEAFPWETLVGLVVFYLFIYFFSKLVKGDKHGHYVSGLRTCNDLVVSLRYSECIHTSDLRFQRALSLSEVSNAATIGGRLFHCG